MKSNTASNKQAHIRSIRRKHRIAQISAVISVFLLALYIFIMNPWRIGAWLVCGAYALFMAVLSYQEKQEFLRNDPESAKRQAEAKQARDHIRKLHRRK